MKMYATQLDVQLFPAKNLNIEKKGIKKSSASNILNSQSRKIFTGKQISITKIK